MSKGTVLLVTNIPTPYRIPFFNELSRQLKEKGYSLKVVFGALGYARRKWQIDMSDCRFEYAVLKSRKLYFTDPDKVMFDYPGLWHLVAKEKPDMIVSNAFSVATFKLWLRSLIAATPYVIWSGAIERLGQRDRLIRKIYRKILVRRGRGFICYGTRAKEYLESLGAESEKIAIAFNTVDTEYFRREVHRLRGEIQHKMDERRVLLYVGHVTEGKRLDQLFQAVKLLATIRRDFLLKIVGDGPARTKLEQLAGQLSIQEFISWEGFRQKNEIPSYFAEADCFLFPSEYDVWGLVLVEAMTSGLPCLASIKAGATIDLIHHGETGFILDFAEPAAVVACVKRLFDDPRLAAALGENAGSFIAGKMSLAKSAEAFISAIERFKQQNRNRS